MKFHPKLPVRQPCLPGIWIPRIWDFLGPCPSELDMMGTDAMAVRYEQTLKEQQNIQKEDLSDMVAEHAAKQKVRFFGQKNGHIIY